MLGTLMVEDTDNLARTLWGPWLASLLSVVFLLFSGVAAIQIAIDPFAVWRTSTTPGLNHRKSGQAGTERLFKIYEYDLKKPDVAFLGNSRGAWGLPPMWGGLSGDRVYNLSFDAQRLGDARRLFSLMLKRHRPGTIVLNLDPIITTNMAFGNENLGGFDDRMRSVTPNALCFHLTKIKETIFTFDGLAKSLESYKNSKANPAGGPFFENGWFTVMGKQLRPQPKNYRDSLWRYFSGMHKLVHPDKSSMTELYRIVDMARSSKVEVVVSFAPMLVDMIASIDANGRIVGLNQTKRQIAAKVPFFDFGYVNSVTVNRFNYIDAVHYRGVVGEMMLRRMSEKKVGPPRVPADFGVLVTRKNIDQHLLMTMERLTAWKSEHQNFFEMLQAAVHHRDKARFERELKKLVAIARQ